MAYVTVSTSTPCPLPRAHFATLVCPTVRSSIEPRSNSLVIGSLPMSLSRVRKVVRWRFIHENQPESGLREHRLRNVVYCRATQFAALVQVEATPTVND